MAQRRIFCSLLVLSALIVLVTVPWGGGQSLTTLLTTITTREVIVGTVSSTVGMTQGRSTLVQADARSTTFAIKPTQGMYGCIYQAYQFPADKDEPISINVKSNLPITIYIMTANDYQSWLNTNSCNAPSNVMYNKQQTSNALLDMVAPTTGDYDIAFLNTSPSSQANVNLDLVGQTQVLTTVSLPVVTWFAVTNTLTTTHILTQTETVTADPIQQYGLPAVLIVVLGLVGFFLLQRRSAKQNAKPSTTSPLTKFCGDCGKEISINATFCERCGAITEDD